MTTTELWTVIGASAGIATAVATAIAAVFAIWMRWHDRPQPDWAITGRWEYPDRYGDDNAEGPGNVVGNFVNAGDGRAFRVTVRGEGCAPSLHKRLTNVGASGLSSVPEHFTAVLEPGESRMFFISKVPPEAYAAAALVLEWTETPTRKRKRRTQVVPLTDFLDAPRPTRFNELTGTYDPA